LLKGANSCRNFSLGHATGNFVVWFDSDDLMLPNALQDRLEKIGDLDFAALQGVFSSLEGNTGLIINQNVQIETVCSFFFLSQMAYSKYNN